MEKNLLNDLLSFEGDREIRESFTDKGFTVNVFYMNDFTQTLLMEEWKKLKDIEDIEYSKLKTTQVMIKHLTDLPKEAYAEDTLRELLKKQSRFMLKIVMEVTNEVAEYTDMTNKVNKSLKLVQ